MSDYKQRMVREHRELQERISKLAHMLEGYAEGTLDFTPACSFQLLESQLYAMGAYANILQERARIEQVDLTTHLLREVSLVRFHRISPCPKCGARSRRNGSESKYGVGLNTRSSLRCSAALSAGSPSREVVHVSQPHMRCNTTSPHGTGICNGDKCSH